jgi:short-subunit dehydrogenase
MLPVQLTGKVAIVTGAGRGIGRATALALSDRGVTVVGVDLDEAAIQELAERTGGSAFTADVRDPAHADAVVAHVLGCHGRLDIVVANAGVGHAGDFVTMPPARIDDLIEVNLRAPMLLVRAALPVLTPADSGAVVLISSIAGALLVPRESVYSATKAAVEAFAVTLREELRGSGVTVSTVLPTAVRTDFFDHRGEPYTRRYPRQVLPGRVADAVVTAIVKGRPRIVVPRWLTIAIRVHAVAPGAYRSLARRWG